MNAKVLTPEGFKSHCQSEKKIDQWLVAYSGGMDSIVLLHLVAKTLPATKVKVIHFDHGLHKNSNQWAQFCRNTCEAYGLAFECVRLNLQSQTGQSIETLAREHRYFYLKQHMTPKTALLLAHHQNDQAETLLYRLFRGTGLDGLKCMQPCQTFATGVLMRPLLAFDRNQVAQYATSQQLKWIEDDSNLNCDFDRNYIRHQILPMILKRWPQAVSKMNDLAQLAATHYTSQQEQTMAEVARCLGKEKNQLNLQELKSYQLENQPLILRAWIQELGYQPPSFDQLLRLQREVIEAGEDKQPLLKLKNYHFRRYRQTLYLYSNDVVFAETAKWHWDMQAPLALPAHPVLTREDLHLNGVSEELLQNGVTVVQGCKGDKGKKIFQTHGIPPWLRTQYLSIFAGDKFIQVLGLEKKSLTTSEEMQGID